MLAQTDYVHFLMAGAGPAGGIFQADFGAGRLMAMRPVSAILHFYFRKMAATSRIWRKRGPVNLYDIPKTILMEPLQAFDVTPVGSPRFRAILQT